MNERTKTKGPAKRDAERRQKMKKAKPFLGILVAALVLQSCMEQKPVKRLEELSALKGKSAQEVLQALGSPRVIDSSASASERIWGYYQVMIRSEVDAKPRQRTVLVVFKKYERDFIVNEVRIP